VKNVQLHRALLNIHYQIRTEALNACDKDNGLGRGALSKQVLRGLLDTEESCLLRAIAQASPSAWWN